ncbi:MAG: glycosyltransferase family 2 protein [Anaerolineales bacterium]
MSDCIAPVISIVVVIYNGRAHLTECVTALMADTASPPFEVWLVDNASTDGSGELADALAAQWPRVHTIHNPTNRGYSGGVNTALPHLHSEFVAVLNPDCVVESGWLSHTVTFLHATPSAGGLSPLILLHDDGRINAAGQDVHVTGLGFNRWLWRDRSIVPVAPIKVSGLHGAAFVMRLSLLEQMGGWDESGFVYHEDVELSWLLQLMGYDLYCVPSAVVWHKYHLSMYPEKLFLLERNRWAMLITHLHRGTRLALAPLLGVTELLIWGYCFLRGIGFLQAKAASYRWVWSQAEHLHRQRAHINTLRRRGDWEVLRGLSWGYAWDQFLSLGRERGPSRRQPVGGLPVELE